MPPKAPLDRPMALSGCGAFVSVFVLAGSGENWWSWDMTLCAYPHLTKYKKARKLAGLNVANCSAR